MLLIDRSEFNSYFSIYYKHSLNNVQLKIKHYGISIEEIKDYEKLREEIEKIKIKIKNIFDTAIQKGETYPLDDSLWFISNDPDKTIECSDKLKLYRILLFDHNMIDEWICDEIHKLDNEVYLFLFQNNRTIQKIDNEHIKSDLLKKVYKFNRTEEDIRYIKKTFSEYIEDWDTFLQKNHWIEECIKNNGYTLYDEKHFNLLDIFDGYFSDIIHSKT